LLVAIAVPQYQKVVLKKASIDEVTQMREGTSLLHGIHTKTDAGLLCTVGDDVVLTEVVELKDGSIASMTFKIRTADSGMEHGCPSGMHFTVHPLEIPYLRQTYGELLL